MFKMNINILITSGQLKIVIKAIRMILKASATLVLALARSWYPLSRPFQFYWQDHVNEHVGFEVDNQIDLEGCLTFSIIGVKWCERGSWKLGLLVFEISSSFPSSGES